MEYNIQRKKITRKTKEYIKEAVKETGTSDRVELCKTISFMLEDKYAGGMLDYQLKRMDLETTGKILEAIDSYMYMQNTDAIDRMIHKEELRRLKEEEEEKEKNKKIIIK